MNRDPDRHATDWLMVGIGIAFLLMYASGALG
jgi:hypothetical protein